MWSTETSLKQSAVEKCFLVIVPSISLKNGGLCWNQAVQHVVYQPSRTPGHPNTVFGWLILFCNHSMQLSQI